jgi:hypothetical protein
MLVYNQASKKSIDNAVAKAKSVKPLARVLGYGRFSVAGSKSSQRYEVRFSADSQGELVVECGCQANSKRSLACYHAAAVAGLFKGQWTEKRAAAALAMAAPAGYLFLTDEDIASGQWGEPMTEQEAIAAGKCASKFCDRLADGLSVYCEDCALELASAYADIMAEIA